MFEINENNEVVCGQTTRAILVGISFEEDTGASMKELEGLAEAAGAQVLGQMVQSRERPDKATYLGKGKVEELAEMCGNMEANTVIFNNELSGAQIRNLEKELGYRVFHRTSKGLELTEKGNVFYQKAQEMLKDWNRFKEEVISGTEHKKLKIGLGARVYSNRLFPKIARYFERHPELEVTFYTEAGLDAYAAIKDGSLDMALDRMPENEIGMEKCVCFAKELIREKQCILMAPDHPLAQKKNASIMDCREYTMLTGLEHSVEDRLLRKTYGEQNITWKRVIRSDSIDTVMKMVKSGSGIAIGPKSFAEYYGVTAVPLVPARQDSLYFACLKSKKKEPEIREFQRYLTTLVSSVYPD